MGGTESIPAGKTNQDDFYRGAADRFGPALVRLARAYVLDPEKSRDLCQDIHFQLWRSFRHYDSRCSLRTWVYRVAHHVAVSHVIRERRTFSNLVNLEELEVLPDKADPQAAADQRMDLNRLWTLIQQLKPLDRQVIVSYLEDMDAASIGEITGLWLNQPAETLTMTSKWIEQKSRELRAKTRRKLIGTAVGPLAAGLLYVFSMKEFAGARQVVQLPFAFALVWSIAGLYFLNRGMWSAVMPGDAGLSSGLEFRGS